MPIVLVVLQMQKGLQIGELSIFREVFILFMKCLKQKITIYIMINLSFSLSLKNSLDLLLPHAVRDVYRDSQGLVSGL